MADEDEKIKNETVDDDVEEEENEKEKPFDRPESPRTTAARYLLDLANFGSAAHTKNNIHQSDLRALSINTWGHDKSQSYIEECGLPFTSDQMLVACRTLTDLSQFLTNYDLTEEQVALCYAAYQMGRGNNPTSNSPGTEPTLDTISGWNYHLIHVLDHSYASMSSLQMENMSTINRKSSTTEDVSYSSDGGASSTGSNGLESDLSRSRKTSWDERNYRRLGLPYTYEEIVDSPMDEFNDLMSNGNLTEEQVILCRNTRRRGKNKVAAQNCRRRKLGLISKLRNELDATRRTRQQLMDERQNLSQDCAEWALRVSNAKKMVLNGLGKNPRKYFLEIIDQCHHGEHWESTVMIRKRKESSEVIPYHDLSEKSHTNCLDLISGTTKEENSFVEIKEEGRDQEDEEKPLQRPSLMTKEEILEIELPSYI